MPLPLTVYKASAGSGKTFRLAIEYIKLLIVNPTSYRNILAVTFTNKATEEMKMRILSQLYGIWKQLPDSERYMQRVVEELHVSRSVASEKAGVALGMLIHNYSYFRVETIDSFFQSVLRNLARELDLTANLRVGLNDVQVEEQAVDQLIDSLTYKDKVLQWILSYISENMSDDKNWNVIGQIKNFGKTIFRDYYKEESEQLNQLLAQPKFFEQYTQDLRKRRKHAIDTMHQYAERFFKLLEDNAITPDMLVGKERGICSYFNKLRGNDWSDKKCVTANLTKSLESADNWVTKTSPHKATVVPVVNDVLLPLLLDAERERTRQWRLYLSCDLTLRHLNQLRLLGTIEQRVRQLNAEANRFLLSDTQQLLHELIGDSDSPFIFEKTGGLLEHIMIDEFQDTSTVQWKNFRLLLLETMSHGGQNREGTCRNLIVGDVKQSIYRWRSGDWRLLNDINGQFQNAGQTVCHKQLNENHRSAQNIIRFNNHFFSEAARTEYEAEQAVSGDDAVQLNNAYKDVEQIIPDHSDDTGYVSVSLLDAEDYHERTLQLLADTISQLLAQGVEANKVAILVRVNRYIPEIADYFMQHLPEVKLVSDEAFRLDASAAVNIMVLALQWLAHPDDMLTKSTLVKSYQREVLHNNMADSAMFEDLAQLDTLLPPSFVAAADELTFQPLYELCEQLYDIFDLATLHDESAYVCTFFDIVSTFAQENTADIDSFVDAWNEDFHQKTIQSDEFNGIRMISIHKSKGLEFDNVLIPFCDWQLEKTSGNTLWCKSDESPFNELPLVPIDYSSRLLDTAYADDYREEHLQNTVDNLNLLYVAFTRAQRNLFVWGQAKASNSRSTLLQQVLPRLPETLEGAEVSEEEHMPIVFTYGQLEAVFPQTSTPTKDSLSDEAPVNVFLAPVSAQRISIETYANKAEFRQSNRSRDFVESNTDTLSPQRTYIKMGNVLHNLFSSIRTLADIDSVLRQLEFEGILYGEDISAERIREMLNRRLSHPQVASWFDPHWTLFNECTILSTDSDTGAVVERRPDRVMTDGKQTLVVDFKFGKPCSDYHDQVRNYMSLLTRMGHPNVKGYLWYVYSNKIEEVKD